MQKFSKFQIIVIGFAFAAILLIPTTTESSYGQSAPSGTVSTAGLIFSTNDDTDCSIVGIWDAATTTCTLTADINESNNKEGISITSSNIILDGAGHTITGLGTVTGQSSNSRAIIIHSQMIELTIKNLTIKNFKTGIASSNNNGLTITNVTMSDIGGYGIDSYGSDSLKIESNSISHLNTESISQQGIYLTGHNAYWGQGNGSCTGTGTYVSSSQDGPIVIKNNTITSTSGSGSGMYIEGSKYCISGNTISNMKVGIHIAATSFNGGATPTAHTLSNNMISGSSQKGINIVSNADGNYIAGNTIVDGLTGIQLSGSDNNSISGNIINNNKPSNFGLAGTSQAMSIGTSNYNTITNNQFLFNNQGVELNSSSFNQFNSNHSSHPKWQRW